MDVHDISIEQSLLGALLIDNKVFHGIGSLTADDFFDPLHAQIFEVARRMNVAGQVVTPTTIAPSFAKHAHVVDGLTVKAYLGRLAASASSLVQAPSYATIIRELASRRSLSRTLAEALGNMGNPLHALSDVTKALQSDVDKALGSMPNANRSTRQSMLEATDAFLDRILNPTDKADCFPTGFADLDKMIGGWRRGQLILLAGRPSMGKSTVGVSSLLKSARMGHTSMLLSLEMSTPEIMARMHCDMAWRRDQRIAYKDVMNNALSERDSDLIVESATRHRNLPLIVDDASGLTVAEIASRVRREKAAAEKDGRRLDIVMIDHIGFIKPSGRYTNNKTAEVGEISGALKQIAKDNEIALIGLSQLNRQTEGRENKRPVLSDLRNSGDLEQDADVVIFTFREAYYYERQRHDPGTQQEMERQALLEGTRNILDLIIAKNRNGPCDTVNLFCDMASNVVKDAA